MKSLELLTTKHQLEIKMLEHIKDCYKHHKKLDYSMYLNYKKLQREFELNFVFEVNNGN
jgi:hypothetical protein